MAVQSVFISSVQSGFADVREAARRGVQEAGMHPVMAEAAPAAADAPRSALLDQVARADIYVLIIGERYGAPGASGFSPTEDEFNHAANLGKPILVFVQNSDNLEPEQRAFLARVREGGWEESTLNATFSAPEELTIQVIRALHAHGTTRAGHPRDVAGRIGELIGRRRPGSPSAALVRIVLVPVEETEVLDVLELDRPELGDEVAALIRAAGLVPQSVGLEPSVTGEGVRVTATDSRDWARPEFALLADGSVLGEGSVPGDGMLRASVVDETKTEAFITQATAFAAQAWDRYDKIGAVRQVAAVIVVPDAHYKSFGTATGNKIATGNPEMIIAPPEPLIAQRAAVTSTDFRRRLLASLRRAFTDLNALAG